jgi:hypothetical protein
MNWKEGAGVCMIASPFVAALVGVLVVHPLAIGGPLLVAVIVVGGVSLHCKGIRERRGL